MNSTDFPARKSEEAEESQSLDKVHDTQEWSIFEVTKLGKLPEQIIDGKSTIKRYSSHSTQNLTEPLNLTVSSSW